MFFYIGDVQDYHYPWLIVEVFHFSDAVHLEQYTNPKVDVTMSTPMQL